MFGTSGFHRMGNTIHAEGKLQPGILSSSGQRIIVYAEWDLAADKETISQWICRKCGKQLIDNVYLRVKL